MPKIVAGIDGGSRAIKVVLLDAQTHQVLAHGSCDQGVEQDALALALYDRLLAQIGMERQDVRRVIATGYARHRISVAHTAVTEITCHAAGVRHLVPASMTVLEIGGQDSKLLRLSADGTVRDFSMNDRCAAGTGRFLEMLATRLDVHLQDLGYLAADAANPATISSTCVVFAESEIIGLLASGVGRQDIVAGVQRAIARRVAAMAGGHLDHPIVFTGGVALVPGMKEAVEQELSQQVQLCPQPQITGALGAAIIASRE